MRDNPLVSVIVPTFNSQATLSRCLTSIKEQTYKNIQLIVVDNCSKDKTVEIAEKFGSVVYKMANVERSAQLNQGVKISTGKYVYRSDSDFVLDKGLIEEAVQKCENESFDAISVYCTPDTSVSFWAKVRKLEKDCYKGTLFYVGARFFRKDVFEAIGGFSEDLVAGEDYDLYNRLSKTKYKIGRLNAEELHLGEPKRLFDIARKQYYYGKTLRMFFKRNGSKGVVQMNPVRLPLLKNWVKFLKHPILTGGFIGYHISICTSALCGLTSVYLSKSGKNN
jgi:glycosyltransferase involved in cell wall biosynthesis